ncbi:MAG: ABC transporter permease [Anaerolineales bacterium]|nr:ABC transporter permease [Anaerolineales bacterium]
MTEMPDAFFSALKKVDWFVLTFALAGAVLLLFVFLPILATLLDTSLVVLWDTLRDAEVQAALWLTFSAGLWATLLAFLCGVPLAYLLARYQFWGKAWVEGLINLPIVIPHTAAGIALLIVLGRRSFVGEFFGRFGISFVDQLPGIVAGMLFVSLPFLVNAARDSFALVDPELERVALSDGASRWQAFSRVTLPLAWRGVLSGALVMWGRGISEFGAVVILAYHPKTIPVLVYERFYGFGLSAAQPVAVILILAALGVFLLAQLLARWQTKRQ